VVVVEVGVGGGGAYSVLKRAPAPSINFPVKHLATVAMGVVTHSRVLPAIGTSLAPVGGCRSARVGATGRWVFRVSGGDI
jgi:hypothetical protein